MANDTLITVIGNLTGDPELRFTPSGSAVANFSIASTPRSFDRTSNEWKDGETLFLRASVWREAAENVAESLTKGMRVIAQGRLKSRSYDKDGEKKTVIEFEVDEIGPSLQYASAKVTRKQKGASAGGFSEPVPSHHGTQQPAQQQPWGGNQPAQNPGGWGNGNQAEAPF